MRERASIGNIGMPALPPWVRNLLLVLFGAYVLELLLVNFAHLPLYDVLAWYPDSFPAAPWQLVTHWLVQGPEPTSVLFGLLALFFALPALDQSLSRRQLLEATVAAVCFGWLTGVVGDLIGLAIGPALGWSYVAGAAFALFGLAMPDTEVRLMFVLPVTGRTLAWGTGVVAALIVLASRSIGSLELLGAWGGVLAWWYQIGPWLRRRRLRSGGTRVAQKAQKFQVLDGGRGFPPDHNVH